MLPIVEHQRDGPPTHEELQQWSMVGLLPPGRGGRQRTIRPRALLSSSSVQDRTTLLEEKLVQEATTWMAPSDVPRPLVDDTKYVLIFFSGHRRWGDIAAWTSWLCCDGRVIPISVDIGIDAQYGDIYNSRLWERLIRARKVVAAHGGPPCETYSLARWLPAPSGRPRPLRSKAYPWGLPQRSVKEVQQCYVGTILMLRTIFLLLLVHCCGGAITLEHPAGHRRTEEQWCIWLAGMIRRFLRDDAVDIIQFLQGPLGQPFSKPTNLLVGRLPMLKHHLFAAYDVTWRPTVLLGGMGEDGWRTAAAKAYPSRLCEILARNYLWFANSANTFGSEMDPPELAAAMKALCRWDPYSGDVETFFSDYHCRTDT